MGNGQQMEPEELRKVLAKRGFSADQIGIAMDELAHKPGHRVYDVEEAYETFRPSRRNPNRGTWTTHPISRRLVVMPDRYYTRATDLGTRPWYLAAPRGLTPEGIEKAKSLNGVVGPAAESGSVGATVLEGGINSPSISLPEE